MFQVTLLRISTLILILFVLILAAIQVGFILWSKRQKKQKHNAKPTKYNLMQKYFLTTYTLIILHEFLEIFGQIDQNHRADARLLDPSIITPVYYTVYSIVQNFLFICSFIIWILASFHRFNTVTYHTFPTIAFKFINIWKYVIIILILPQFVFRTILRVVSDTTTGFDIDAPFETKIEFIKIILKINFPLSLIGSLSLILTDLILILIMSKTNL